jgi:hypothetical protein
VQPPNVKVVHDYQASTLGFSARSGEDIAAGVEYKFYFVGKLPPTDAHGFIDREATNLALTSARPE